MILRFLIAAVSVLSVAVPATGADELPGDQDRLISIAKLWSAVEYFHPYLAYRTDIDWDKALVDALPDIRAAKTHADYARAVQKLLDALKDPLSSTVSHGPNPDDLPQRTWVHSPEGPAFLVKPGPVSVITLPLGGGVEATVRLSEPFKPTLTPVPSPAPDPRYSAASYPSTEYRILAAYKIWSTISNFFAYTDLMDEDWESAFAEFLPKFINAKTAREYHLAVAEAMTHVDDSQVHITSSDLDDYFGIAPAGLRVRLLDKKPVITEVLDADARAAGLKAGDIVLRVDDEEMVARIKREAEYIPFSTRQALADDVMQRVLKGPDGSDLRLTVQTGSGATKEFTLRRSSSYTEPLMQQRSGDVVKVLNSNIGYIDMERLAVDQVDAAFERLRNARAIVFDARGRFQLDPAIIASHLTGKEDAAGAIVTGRLALAPDLPQARTLTNSASFFRVERVPPGKQPVYSGKTVMLIDERTRGDAEIAGLFMEAANSTTFIGTLSAGAAGQVDKMSIPGGITITYSRTDVRHGNSGKLQRVGIQPAVEAPTTLGGVRAGRDEVLDKAIAYLSQDDGAVAVI